MGVLACDPVLARLIDDHGPLTIEPADDLFARLISSIVSQQLSTASATAIHDRLTERFELTPAAMLSADTDRLLDCGLSGRKVEYIQNVAHAFDANEYSRSFFEEHSDAEVIDELTAITGVGVWTAKMMLIFGLGREDVFPIEDLGIRNAMDSLYDDPSRAEKREIAAQWRPKRSIAALHLWKHYEQ
ncbi:DNA-3-methyladenine glycosylase family protein [Halocatena halophila]|uniref:DNA-3-methyladenine glycosylase family protein n=1 Tax=Halocatena halophila TaxID=2814576 RepID=UPI002ED6AB1F